MSNVMNILTQESTCGINIISTSALISRVKNKINRYVNTRNIVKKHDDHKVTLTEYVHVFVEANIQVNYSVLNFKR